MISHYPRYRFGASPGLVHKLGGLPWGLPLPYWPACAECCRPMSLLLQAPSHSPEAGAPALPLPTDEVLYAFKCEWHSICNFWESDTGANVVFSLPRSALGDSPTAAPQHAEDGPPRILPELGVADWNVADDGAPAVREADFYDYDLHAALPDTIAHAHGWAIEWRSKFGGVPCWTANGVQQVPPGRLLLQIDNYVQMEEGGLTEVANFCLDGTAFIFIDRAQTPPTYAMIINR